MHQTNAIALAGTAPTTIAALDAAAIGVGLQAAKNDHRHGMFGTWTKVAAGVLGAVASIDLAALSGYKRYHLVIHARVPAAGGTTTVKLNNSAAHAFDYCLLSGTATTVFTAVASATINVAGGYGGVAAGVLQIELTVAHDDQAASPTSCIGRQTFMSATAADCKSVLFQGADTTALATITEILVAFGATITNGNYVLYGSNEVA